MRVLREKAKVQSANSAVQQQSAPGNLQSQIVNRQRVADYGEVYTSQREVTAMLDLVKQETERIESRFLEPACGTGNFLLEVLARKLAVVENRYRKNVQEYELYSCLAVSSLYGIDILDDNVQKCRGRLFDCYNEKYMELYGLYDNDDLLKSISYILQKNIIVGDALTLKTTGGSETQEPQAIVFPEWSIAYGSMMKRRDFTFFDILTRGETNTLPLFSDAGEDVYLPEPKKDYPLISFLKVYEHG